MEWSVLPSDPSSSSSSSLTDRAWLYSLRRLRGGGYELHLTDAARVFRERLAPKQVLDRCGDLNPAVEAEAEDLVEEIAAMLEDRTSHVALAEEDYGGADDAGGGGGEGGMRLRANGKLFGYDFKWHFVAARLGAEKAYGSLLCDLLKCVSHLLNQRRHLLQVVQAKDLEIFDYEQGGASLTRRTLKTDKFDRATALDKVPYVPVDDPGLVKTLASEDFRGVQRAVEAGGRRRAATAITPEEERAKARARKKRIRIKGAGAQLLRPDDLENDDEEEDKSRVFAKESGEKRPSAMSDRVKSKKVLAKKLRKL